jgi:diguanylate cyclase (GGDEF)-like protein
MRITRKIFVDLAIWMVGFGIIVGIVFPFFAKAFGVRTEIAYSPWFFVSCIAAGILVGAVNIILSRVVIAKKLRLLISRMKMVRDNLMKVVKGGDLDECTPEKCHISVDSSDEIGESAFTFNKLVDTLSDSLSAERTMQEYTKMLTSQLELSALAKSALSSILNITGFDAGAILIEREGELEPIESSGIKKTERLSNHPLIMEVLKTKKIKITEVPDDIKIDGLLLEFRPKVIIIEPLIYNDIPIGVIVLTSMSDFSDDAINRIGMFSQSLSLAMHNAVIHEQMQKLAAIDPLTGLLNRRYGMIRLKEEYSKAVRSEGSLGVVMFDIDHFKKVNDTYGHLAGDRVLIHIARLVKPILREGDVLMRYGGEEFCAILPGASVEDAMKMAERIRFAVQESQVNYTEYEIKVTLSLGITSYPENNVNNEQLLLSTADEALYISKESGRNKSSIK